MKKQDITAPANRPARRQTPKEAMHAAKESPHYDPLLDVKGAAAYAHCSAETIRRAARARELATLRTGGNSSHIRVRLSALNAWLKKMEQPARRNA